MTKDAFTLHHGDCLEVLRTMAPDSIDAVVTDPPYGLAFMGKRWDYDVPSVEIWAECLRVLKPGSHLLAFAGTRTQHRMAVRIEDAGFEIRDMIAWVYGSGFPKSLAVDKALDGVLGKQSGGFNTAGGKEKFDKQNKSFRSDYGYKYTPVTEVARQWQGWGTALKPALEPITVARKPLAGTVAENVLQWGTGAINVDGCRIAAKPGDYEHLGDLTPRPMARNSLAAAEEGALKVTQAPPRAIGRWPSNLIHDGSDEATAGLADAARFFKQCKGYAEAWPDLPPEPANTAGNCSSQQRRFVAFALGDAATWALHGASCNNVSLAPSTSATANELRQLSESVITAIQSIAPRFWQESRPARLSLSLNHANFAVIREQTGITTITASHWKSDGSADPVTFSITASNTEGGARASAPRAFYTAKASRQDRDPDNRHPTVKPTDLMRYLCRLVTPPGGLVLDPFMGSGSTGKAAMLEGFDFLGIERDADSFATAERRLRRAAASGCQANLLDSLDPGCRC